jgi:hypothetical protein
MMENLLKDKEYANKEAERTLGAELARVDQQQ